MTTENARHRPSWIERVMQRRAAQSYKRYPWFPLGPPVEDLEGPVRLRWWQRLRAGVLLTLMIGALGLASAALIGTIVVLTALMLERAVG